MDFPKKQQQSLIPKYLLDYLGEVNELHPDPSDLGGGDNIEAGTGIEITGDETKTISVDDTVAMKTDIPDVSDFITENEVDTKLEDYELKSEAFSGSYNDLTDKPDLSVYELKADAFSGDYNDLTDKPDLSVYALSSSLASVATTGDYNDLSNKPTIPDTSNFVTTNTAQTITGIKTFNTDIYLSRSKHIKSDLRSNGSYESVLSALQGVVELGNYGSSTRIYGSSRPHIYYYENNVSYNGDVALTSDIPTVNNSTITITQGGVTKGTFTLNQNSDSTIALDAGSTPTNMVTTDTNQNITSIKGFTGDKRIKFFDGNSTSNKMGFTCYHSAYTANPSSNNENGYLEAKYSDRDLNNSPSIMLGMYNSTNINKDRYLGFKYYSNNNGTTNKCNLVVPTNRTESTIRYIPVSVNGSFADNTGNISIAIPTVPTNVSAFTNDAGYITQQALVGYQTTSNLVTSISSQSTDNQYPSAKCVYDIVGDIETLLAAL